MTWDERMDHIDRLAQSGDLDLGILVYMQTGKEWLKNVVKFVDWNEDADGDLSDIETTDNANNRNNNNKNKNKK